MVIIKLPKIGNKLQEKTEMHKLKQSKTQNDTLIHYVFIRRMESKKHVTVWVLNHSRFAPRRYIF